MVVWLWDREQRPLVTKVKVPFLVTAFVLLLSDCVLRERDRDRAAQIRPKIYTAFTA